MAWSLVVGALLAEVSEPEAPVTYRESIRLLDPMGLTEVDREVASLLRNYYSFNFTDAESWDRLQSIRFEGLLHLPQGSLRFIAFKKKPDFTKIVIFSGDKPILVMAYDGEDAWQIDLSQSSEPSSMPAVEALNFIRDATTGGHLFYPEIINKKIELKGASVVGGRRCYELLITLPNGQMVTSFLDMANFSEYQQRTTNAASGNQEMVRNLEFRDYEGIRIPVRSDLIVDGQVAHTVEMINVQFNLGVMPWMFARSSGAYLPGLKRSAGPSAGDSKSSTLFGPVESINLPDSTSNLFTPFAAPSAFGK